MKLSGAVFVGGKSRRMGTPKQTLRLGSQTLLERTIGSLSALCTEVFVVGGDQSELSIPAGVSWVGDGVHRGKGPLAGIVAALNAATNPYVLCRGVDMPFLSHRLVHHMSELAASHTPVMVVQNGRPATLCAIYHTSLRATFEARLEAGERSVRRALSELEPVFVEEERAREFDPTLQSLVNINTPQDFELIVATMRTKTPLP